LWALSIVAVTAVGWRVLPALGQTSSNCHLPNATGACTAAHSCSDYCGGCNDSLAVTPDTTPLCPFAPRLTAGFCECALVDNRHCYDTQACTFSTTTCAGGTNWQCMLNANAAVNHVNVNVYQADVGSNACVGK
jgi:hypothetical protein